MSEVPVLIDREGLKAKGVRLSRPQLDKLIRAGVFPAPVKIGLRHNTWVEAEVDAYIRERIASRPPRGTAKAA